MKIVRFFVACAIGMALQACSNAQISERPAPQPAADSPEGADTRRRFDDRPTDETRSESGEELDRPSSIIIDDGSKADSNEHDSDDSATDDDDNGDDGSDRRKSGGSGGRTGNFEVSFTSADGTQSTYRIEAPADIHTKLYGLHIHLHGDGGGGYRDFPNREARHDLVGVTVKAPNRNLQWGRIEGVRHANYLNELIQQDLIKKYNVDLDRIYFSGVSGGAYFLTGNFIPTHGSRYKSGAFVLCGGETPRVAFQDETFLKDFRIHFQVTAGERRDILSSVQASISAYQSALQQIGSADSKILTSSIEGQGGHCVFDGRSYTTGIQAIMNDKFNVVLQ